VDRDIGRRITRGDLVVLASLEAGCVAAQAARDGNGTDDTAAFWDAVVETGRAHGVEP
jgi:hypothetical protein